MSATTGGNAGEGTPFGPGSFEIALLAARRHDHRGRRRARPAGTERLRPRATPGHHPEADRGRGFCIFGNVVVAIEHAGVTRGLGRVAVVDWDVHHGNGTQEAFYRDPGVLTISIHQDRWYPPESGAMEERGEGPGLDTTSTSRCPRARGTARIWRRSSASSPRSGRSDPS